MNHQDDRDEADDEADEALPDAIITLEDFHPQTVRGLAGRASLFRRAAAQASPDRKQAAHSPSRRTPERFSFAKRTRKSPRKPRRSKLFGTPAVTPRRLVKSDHEEPPPEMKAKKDRDGDIVEEVLERGYPLIEHGLMVVMSKKMDVVHRIWQSSEGQDKLFKWFNGFIRCFNFGLKTVLVPAMPLIFQSVMQELMSRLSRLRKATSLTRKFLKIFNVFIFIRLVAHVWMEQKENSFLKMLVLGRFGGLLVYFWGNFLVWMVKTGLLRYNAMDFTRLALRGYTSSIFCTFILDFHRLVKTRAKIKTTQKKLTRSFADTPIDELERIFKDKMTPTQARDEQKTQLEGFLTMQKSLFKGFFKNSIDCTAALNVLMGWNFSEGLIGLLALISSSFAILRLWTRNEQKMQKYRKRLKRSLRTFKQRRLLQPNLPPSPQIRKRRLTSVPAQPIKTSRSIVDLHKSGTKPNTTTPSFRPATVQNWRLRSRRIVASRSVTTNLRRSFSKPRTPALLTPTTTPITSRNRTPATTRSNSPMTTPPLGPMPPLPPGYNALSSRSPSPGKSPATNRPVYNSHKQCDPSGSPPTLIIRQGVVARQFTSPTQKRKFARRTRRRGSSIRRSDSTGAISRADSVYRQLAFDSSRPFSASNSISSRPPLSRPYQKKRSVSLGASADSDSGLSIDTHSESSLRASLSSDSANLLPPANTLPHSVGCHTGCAENSDLNIDYPVGQSIEQSIATEQNIATDQPTAIELSKQNTLNSQKISSAGLQDLSKTS